MSLDLITETGEKVTPRIENGGLATATLSPTLEVAISTNGTDLQVVGSTSVTGTIATLSVAHTLECDGVRQIGVSLLGDGSGRLFAIDEAGRSSALANIARPWAVDADGKELPTWYENDGAILRQRVDTAGARAPVFFDPTYSFLSCNSGHFADRSAYDYLNFQVDSNDLCPVMGMFVARNGYRPRFGFETNVAREYGKVIAREDGGCSAPAENEGLYWDFKLPCQAHDYCYDLRKAGFSGTVSDAGCDDAFFYLMDAHCKHRLLRDQCNSMRDTYWAGVRAPWVVTDPDPAEVEIFNRNSLQCVDVKNFSQAQDAEVIQFFCGNRQVNQLWKISPVADSPGLFRLIATHSGKCADAWLNVISQWSCSYAEQIMRIQGSFNTDVYTIRPQFTSFTDCIDVPYSSMEPSVQLINYHCFETMNQQWFIH